MCRCVWACVCIIKNERQPARMKIEHMHQPMCARDVHKHIHIKKRKKERKSLGTHFCHNLSSFNDPFSLALSTHLSLCGYSCSGWCVCVCVCDDLCVTDQCLSHCLRLGVCMFCLFSAKLKSLVTTYQRNIEFGHTRDSTQPPCQSSLLCFPLSHHPLFLLHSKLSCWQ